MPCLHALNLFSAGIARQIKDAPKPVSQHKAQTLDKLVDTTDWPDAEEDDISDSLSPVTNSHCTAVFDVGQGNCNAVLDSYGRPCCYFDFGGGITNNAFTYPLALSSFCFCSNNPPIVLSHWDWDHWSSAMRYHGAPLSPGAAAARWIVPRQSITTVHMGIHTYQDHAFSRIILLRLLGPERNLRLKTVHLSYRRDFSCAGAWRMDMRLTAQVYPFILKIIPNAITSQRTTSLELKISGY